VYRLGFLNGNVNEIVAEIHDVLHPVLELSPPILLTPSYVVVRLTIADMVMKFSIICETQGQLFPAGQSVTGSCPKPVQSTSHSSTLSLLR
jgi:hypothetical protein